MEFRHSIRVKLTSVLITTVLSILILVSAAILAFAEQFYYSFEKENIVSNFQKVNEFYGQNLTTEQMEEKLWAITQKTSIRIVIVDPVLNFYSEQPIHATTYLYGESYDTMISYLRKISTYSLMGGDSTTKMLVEGIEENGYVVAETGRNVRNSNDIFLFGQLDNDYLIAMQIPLESMQSTVKIFTQFLAYVAMIAILFSATVMSFVSTSFTRPIKEMANVAQRM